MDRKKTFKQPVVEKIERNPWRDLKPGIFIPEFRLYGLEKTTDETTVKYYNETQYVERKANHKPGHRFGCEVRLSETSPKTVNVHHQNERRLKYQLDEILRSRHRAFEDNVVGIQKLATESTMKVKRRTVPLKDLKIPGQSYRDVMCTCSMKGESSCNIHPADRKKSLTENTLHRIPTKPHHLTKRHSFLVTDVDSDSDDDRYATVPKPNAAQASSFQSHKRRQSKSQSITPRMSRASLGLADSLPTAEDSHDDTYKETIASRTKPNPTKRKSVMFAM